MQKILFKNKNYRNIFAIIFFCLLFLNTSPAKAQFAHMGGNTASKQAAIMTSIINYTNVSCFCADGTCKDVAIKKSLGDKLPDDPAFKNFINNCKSCGTNSQGSSWFEGEGIDIFAGTCKGKKSAFSFAVISDTPNKQSSTQGPALIDSVDFLNERKPDFVVLLGDLTYHGNTNEFTEFNSVFLSKLNIPVVPVAGNHDFYNSGGSTNWYSFWKNKSQVLPAYKTGKQNSCGSNSRFSSFTYKGQKFDLIDPYFSKTQTYGLAQEELDCIDKSVDAGDLVFRHVTPYGLTCNATNNICGTGVLGKVPGAVQDIDQLPNKLISRGAKALFAGHTHGYYHGKCNGLEYINNGTMGNEMMEYLKGWTSADTADEFTWVDVSADGSIEVTMYIYDAGSKSFEPQTKAFPATVNSQLMTGLRPGVSGEGVSASCASIQPGGANGDELTKLQIYKPNLIINIPQLTFSDVEANLDDQGFLHLPWIGEYLSAIYKFAMVVGSIIAVIMAIFVGVKILTLGGEERVAGIKRLGQITVGLLILWGSYLILNTINPDLVNFDALKVKYVTPDDSYLGTETLTPGDKSESGGKIPYKFQYFKNGCPVKLSNGIFYNGEKLDNIIKSGKNIPRRIEFHQKIASLITGPILERITKAVEATALCQIQYESCGVATTNIYALAAEKGTYGDDCLKATKDQKHCNILGNSHGNIHKTIIHDVYSQQTRGIYCPGEAFCKGKTKWPGGCMSDKTAASNKLKSILTAKGWKPNWINELLPGDYYAIQNWNTGSCQADHSAMFLGWADKANKVAWVEKADAGSFVRIGTKKFEDTDIILQISRPKN